MPHMSHPDMPGVTVPVPTVEAFDAVWAFRGWELVDTDTDAVHVPSTHIGHTPIHPDEVRQARIDAGLESTDDVDDVDEPPTDGGAVELTKSKED